MHKLYLKIDELREKAFDMIENHIDELDDDHLTTFKRLLDDEKNINIESDEFGDDVAYSLNLCVEILTTLEHKGFLTEKEIFKFEGICDISLKLYRFDEFILDEGDLIIYENHPYIITEIDYDECTVHLAKNCYDDYGFYIDFDEIK